MDKQKVSAKLNLPYDEAVSHLKALVKGMESGTIVIQSGEESITLSPRDQVNIKVEAKTKKDKAKFSLELSWIECQEDTLSISDTAPEEKSAPALEHSKNPALEANGAPALVEGDAPKAVTDKFTEAKAEPKPVVEKAPEKKLSKKAPAKKKAAPKKKTAAKKTAKK